jgi:hypothetical protein
VSGDLESWTECVKTFLQFMVMGGRDLDGAVKFLQSIPPAPDLSVKFCKPGVVINKPRALGAVQVIGIVRM